CQARELELARAHTTTRDRLLSLGLDPPAPSGESLLDDWRTLADWAERKALDADEVEVRVVEALEQERVRRSDVLNALAELARSVDEPPDEGLSERLTRRLQDARASEASLRARLEVLEGQRRARDSAAADHSVADELGRLLGARGFERWLLAEALAELAARATERLMQLSGGQYSLVVDADAFRVRDHRNADELRDARTLSGGETFLASLALALALADSVAELAGTGAPPLESVFLDEGFGTLDPETLDVVASALEELGAAGRMVAVVTHIRELADRLPVQLEVRRGPVTSTVSRVER
ncbi:MAG: hypothetical protein KDB21_19710, partial [Acidimicrobiales bacterium]|nr:hypothetical protein [Acidimicrobiales bacterium]